MEDWVREELGTSSIQDRVRKEAPTTLTICIQPVSFAIVTKAALTTRTVRGWNGKTCAPLGPEKRKHAKFENGVAGAVIGGLAGALGGPVGIIVGAVAGACIGSSRNPDRR